jgi:ABC-2 type transport system ATP-binding protein
MVNKNDNAISIRDLRKIFSGPKGKRIVAVDGISLQVKRGQIFGFLGTNGAGKTTTLRMLSTLMPIDEGEVVIAGYDVAKDPGGVRKSIGYVSQSGGSDASATAMENLLLQGRLYDMPKAHAATRAKELLADFGLLSIVNRPASTYSGGQKRRLDIAMGIIHRPQVLFLDEPTTGLDPQSRADLWQQVRSLKQAGTTVMLTSHYLDEVDALADELSIMNKGKIVAQGSPKMLKRRFSSDHVTIQADLTNRTIESIKQLLAGLAELQDIRIGEGVIQIQVANGAKALPRILHFLEDKKVSVRAASIAQPSLDDIFLKQTSSLEAKK